VAAPEDQQEQIHPYYPLLAGGWKGQPENSSVAPVWLSEAIHNHQLRVEKILEHPELLPYSYQRLQQDGYQTEWDLHGDPEEPQRSVMLRTTLIADRLELYSVRYSKTIPRTLRRYMNLANPVARHMARQKHSQLVPD
jgi:hypothetical protein